ncbi:MAG: methionyl-tRNA formyltransferase [Porphyromonadaceae bacterium CG2_30_38_12]|nr:MAG: methionyl-tRNA formyltransferase [Porphyromonadaceae bacterium CG2_30_38_12]
MRIVFMGTPDFAVESLKTLVENNYQVVGVVTMPDKPAGRGHKIQFSPVKQYALEKQLPLLQPEKLKDQGFLNALKSWRADVQVVVAFRMLPELVWNMPPLGTFNLHASLLPQYRGAAPINYAIMQGETQTGATTFFLTHEIDTGKIILQRSIPILESDDAGSIHDKLMVLGAKMVCQTIDLLRDHKINAIDQSQFVIEDIELKTAPKIFKENCAIDIHKSVEENFNFVRGLSPYPTAHINMQLSPNSELLFLKVYAAEKELVTHNDLVGSVFTDGKTYIKIALFNGFLRLKSIQAPAKKRMDVADFLRGIK